MSSGRSLTVGLALGVGAVLRASAHDIVNPFAVPVNPVLVGGPSVPGSAWGELLEDPNGILAVTAVTQIPADPTCSNPLATQFSVARGFAGANGFVISNAYVEDFDDDGTPAGSPNGCANLVGQIGSTQFGVCTGLDTPLSLALQQGYGYFLPIPTSNAAVFEVAFTASQPTSLDVSYTFATFESPADTFFFDSFGIFLDGTLVAGGVTRNASAGSYGGPIPGTDPWTLTPSPGLPAPEFNRPPMPALYYFPAHTTGLRTLPLPLSAGSHTLVFHVADGDELGAGCLVGGTTLFGADPFIPSVLFFGLSTFDSGLPASPGVCGTASITRLGHPAETVGPHGPTGAGFQDFQVRETGATPGTAAFVLIGGAPASIPVSGACNLFVSPVGPYFLAFPAGIVPANGALDWPPTPPAIPAGTAGANVYVQFWNLLPSGALENTKGMRVNLGPS
ncbi:MAG: hypothetical protein L0323_19410 [Planctomycetes bacterium]|nr:hypothetical protein [Planctomycetota bacterium]